MIKKEIAYAIKKHTKCAHLDQKDILAVIDAFTATVNRQLSKGRIVQIRGFGKFEPRHEKEKLGMNIRAKTRITIPARTVVKFVAGKKLKESTNQPKL